MLETPTSEIQKFNGLNIQISPTNLKQGVYAMIRNIVPRDMVAERCVGKIFHSSYEKSIISITQFGKSQILIQAYDEIRIEDI